MFSTKNLKNCVICDAKDAKYKCPTCRAPYCSVACCKSHKGSDECKPPPAQDTVIPQVEPETSTLNSYLYPTEDTVPIEKLQLLGKSEEVKNLIENPHLQTILKHLDTAKDPKSAVEEAMQEPLFVEFADACMKIVDPE